jgi:murein DD-endopeptidase MepM/ murein hydrolase activator NlpD
MSPNRQFLPLSFGKIKPMRHFLIPLSMIVFLLTSCNRTAPNASWTPLAPATLANPNLPSPVPVMTYLPPTRAPGVPISSPTANVPEILPTFTPQPANATQVLVTATVGPDSYSVQAGDQLGKIAEQFDISLDDLLAANNLTADTVIHPGDTLLIPGTTNTDQQQAPILLAPSQVASSDFFKIIPDSELVYGPLSSLLDVDAFVQKQGGYLAFFTQDVDGETLTGAQIINKVARNYSVNPRLLLAVLEYRSQWVTNPNPASSTSETPIGYVDNFYVGFYRQMAWTANALSGGFYGWRGSKITEWNLSDDSTVIPQPGINPGTAGVQAMFAKIDDNATWQIDTGPHGLYATYNAMFGYPFDWAIEPLLPPGLTQPTLELPFAADETWQFTGGPHMGWDTGSPWAALDFAPPGEPIGCGQTDAWVTAMAPGLIVRADHGAVVEDLDGDGLEQTGWTILYMHVENRERVQPGQVVEVGQKIGHPSCEGGLANATHLHIARRYNGVWIPALDSGAPFVLGGYTPTSDGVEYGGWLTRGETVIEAVDGHSDINQITP